jgi:hypothetical protein
VPVYFGGNGTLEKVDGYNQARFPLHLNQNAFETGEWAAFDEHRLAHLKIRIRSDEQSRPNHDADALNLRVGNMLGRFAEPHHIDNPGRGENG